MDPSTYSYRQTRDENMCISNLQFVYTLNTHIKKNCIYEIIISNNMK